MTCTWEIESQILPKFMHSQKEYFLTNTLIGQGEFICESFNTMFNMFFEYGRLKQKIVYEPNEFFISLHEIKDEKEMLLYIELPPPRDCDFSYNVYVKCYFIPFRFSNDKLEVFDTFGIDAVKDMDVGFIIRYMNGQHMMSTMNLPVNPHDRVELISFMSKYIFERV